MGDQSNLTLIRFSGHIELHRFRLLYFSFMLLLYLFILFSNCTIILIILLHRTLHQPMYVFIAALLFNSVFYSTVIYPKLLVDFLSEEQVTSYAACLLQCFCYYTLNGAEFLLLAAMSYDRFLSICRPLRYAAVMATSRVAACVGVAWLLPACQVALPVALSVNTRLCSSDFRGIFCNNLIYKLHCRSSPLLSIYGVVALINLTVLPVAFILYTYSRIFLITYRSGSDVRRKAAHTCLPHLLVLINYTCFFASDVIFVKLEADFSNVVRLSMSLQVIGLHPLCNPIIYGLKMTEITRHIRGCWGTVKAHLVG